MNMSTVMMMKVKESGQNMRKILAQMTKKNKIVTSHLTPGHKCQRLNNKNTPTSSTQENLLNLYRLKKNTQKTNSKMNHIIALILIWLRWKTLKIIRWLRKRSLR